MVTPREHIEQQGFAILPGVLGSERIGALLPALEEALVSGAPSVLRSRGHVYGVRNLNDVWPAALEIARDPIVTEAIGTPRHRRTLHFEFAASRTLPDGLEWHRFLR